MTLGSALPWRACSPLGRITIQPRPVFPRAVRPRALIRLQSTEAGALASQERTRDRHAPTERPLSLLDRLDRTPLWLHGEEDPVVVRPAIAYPHKREAREALQRKHRALTQQARVERHRKQPRVGDWRSILHHLMRWTPTYGGVQDGIKVVIPEHSAQLLWSDCENNVWNIKSRTGCDMTLYRATDSAENESGGEGEGEVKGDEETQTAGENKDPYIVLTGEPTAVSAAVYDILKVTKGVSVIGLRGGTQTVLHEGQTTQPPPAQSITSLVTPTRVPHYPMSAPCQPYTLNIRADQIPRPKEWTIESFQHYVAALTMGRVHQSLAAKLYPGADTHQNTVVRQLLDVFNDPAASAAVSSPAFKLALEYLVRAGETFVKDARDLFASVGALGLRLDTQVYNLLAETAAKSKNLLAFEGVIRRMTACGHAPDLRTWLLFLRMIEAEDVRRYILHAMGTKNFLSNPSTVASVSQEMADHDVHRAVQLGQDFDAFLAGLRALYGPEWRLPRRAANRYLDVFGRYSRFDECKKLLEYMFASDHCKPNTTSLNTVLTHCKLQNKVDLAVCFVRMFDQQGLAAVADDVTFHLLFEVARKTRKTYLLSAVWRYAHLLGMTKHSLRSHGLRLLAGDEHEVEYMTYWLRGLWEGPHACDISKKALLEGLLLCDARRLTGARQLMAGPVTDSNHQENAPPSSFPDHSTDHSPQHKYYLYTNFMSNLSQHHTPAIPLGDFLQSALDHDRKLRRMLLAGERVPISLVMHTVQLPLTKLKGERYRVVNPMVSWLAENAGKEEDGAVKEMRMLAEEMVSAREEAGEVRHAVSAMRAEEEGVGGLRERVESGGEEVGVLADDELARMRRKKERRLKRRAREKEKKRAMLASVVGAEGQAREVKHATGAGLLLQEVVGQKQEAAESGREEVAVDNQPEETFHAIQGEKMNGLLQEAVNQEASEPVQEEVLLNERTEKVLHARAEPLPIMEAERELPEGVMSREVAGPTQEMPMGSQTEETPHVNQTKSVDDLPQETLSQEVAEPLQEAAMNSQTKETSLGTHVESMDDLPQEAMSQEVAGPLQDVAMDNQPDELQQRIQTQGVDDLPQDTMSREVDEPMQDAAMNSQAGEITHAVPTEEFNDQSQEEMSQKAAQSTQEEVAEDKQIEGIPYTIQVESVADSTQEAASREAAVPIQTEAAMTNAHDREKPEEARHTILQLDTGDGLLEVKSQDIAEPIQEKKAMDHLEAEAITEETLSATQPRRMTMGRAIEETDNSTATDAQVQPVGTSNEVVDDLVEATVAQSARLQSSEEINTQLQAPPQTKQAEPGQPNRALGDAALAGQILKWDRKTQTFKRVRPMAPRPRQTGKDRARRQILKWDRKTQTFKAPDDASLPPSEAPKQSGSPTAEPSPIEAAQREAEEQQLRDEAEDREAQERAHKVLHYLMGAAAKFGPTRPQTQHSALSAGLLGADGWRAAEGQKKAPGYLLGPSREFEGSRIHGGG